MDRYLFLDLYVGWSRLIAGIVAIAAVVMAFKAWDAGFWVFLSVLGGGAFYALLIVVFADVLVCFKAIEQNTRKS